MGKSSLVAASAALLAVLVLAGCTPAAPVAVPSASRPASASPHPTPTVDPKLTPAGTADQNKAYFDFVNEKLFTANGSAKGRDIIDNLVAAGFDKAAMQVTPDKTAINGQVDSILFSVKLGAQCLLGQHGGGGYTSSVQAALVSGGCLIGKTRPIDW